LKINNPAEKVQIKVDNIRRINFNQSQIEEIIFNARDHGDILTPGILALGCELRCNEILQLEWKDVDFEEKIITLPCSYTKNGMMRKIVLPSVVINHLLTVRRENPFSKKVTSISTHSEHRIAFEKLRESLSFQTITTADEKELKLHFHDLRHAYGQFLLDAGYTIKDIATLYGHQSTQITQQRYVHFNNRELAKNIDELSKVIKIG
jgi:integrase